MGGIFQARILEWEAIILLQIFPTQGSNPGLPHCRQTLYRLSHQGRGVEWNKNSAVLSLLGRWMRPEEPRKGEMETGCVC